MPLSDHPEPHVQAIYAMQLFIDASLVLWVSSTTVGVLAIAIWRNTKAVAAYLIVGSDVGRPACRCTCGAWL
jgi:hypothetical protein